ncbi:SLBB domain-containing protein [Pedobacter flavus]|uniref:SLBB domain-containing protein n=1 Tax=Pedobacter flavus TaxID=3113906 RepID=A0ABU7H0F2_9SPHI|nr:SLBB domain-containing protein [Pedobacter sp. VNH31]MEE1884729.1 SLBB domain-containing protein [Pedobacter sp. VNH31]
MRLKIFLSLIFLGLVFFIPTSQAQIPTSVDLSNLKSANVTDAKLLEIYKQFEGQYSEDEATSLLIKQGLDPLEANLLSERLKALRASGATGANKPSGPARPMSYDYSRDTTKVPPVAVVKKASKIFGMDLFNNPNLSFEPNYRVATPKGYILGADDEVNVIFTGLNEAVTTSRISPEGNLQVNRLGLINLNGKTIEQAYDIIKLRAQQVAYPALATGQTKLSVTLGSVKTIRVTIIGEVALPGTHPVSGLSTLFNALYRSGGPTNIGSFRNIELIRGNKVIKTVDLYSFIQSGIMSENVRLEDQDVIRIPAYTKRVAVDGEIRKPGLYELKSDETIADLVKYASGFSDNAYKSIAKVSQINDRERSVKDVSSDMFDRYVLKNADSVFFGAILDRYSNRVNLEGAVFRPGPFELEAGLTLKKLIEKGEGLREDASLVTGFIKRTNPNLDKVLISFNPQNILSGKDLDITLLREDTVVIKSRQELLEKRTVTIGGNVRNPGIFEYRKGMTVSDILVMANGFLPEAATHRIEVSRIVMDRSDAVSNNLINLITVNLDSLMMGEGGKFGLEPLDYIYVPRLVNYKSLGNIKVTGEVLFPGNYPLTRRDETAAEFIKRAGGLTPVGSLENAQVFRNGTRVGINLSNVNLKNQKGVYVLLEGDSVHVPRLMPFVEVAGAVNTPQLINFSSSNFSYYINAAGGLKENARLKNAYVQYPNGTNQPVKKFLFFKNFPRIIEGSKIVVPEQQGGKGKLNVVEISAIASGLTALLTVVAIFIK